METSSQLLRQEFEKRKNANPNFSLRSFARWLGVSPAQLSQMISGKRAITFPTMQKICSRLGLSPTEWSDVANSILNEKKITSSNEFKFKVLKEDKFKLIADWYHLAILSLTKTKGATGDTRWVARRLGISSETASDAMTRLTRLGLLQIKPEFKQIGDPFEVSSDVPSPTIRKYHQQMFQLMIEKVETVPNHLRELQSMTIPVDPKKIDILKKMINKFTEDIASNEKRTKGDEIYALNIQLVPLTTIKGDSYE